MHSLEALPKHLQLQVELRATRRYSQMEGYCQEIGFFVVAFLLYRLYRLLPFAISAVSAVADGCCLSLSALCLLLVCSVGEGLCRNFLLSKQTRRPISEGGRLCSGRR
jgi:hypothetical protein